jgi:hypothetical protein
MGMRMKRHFFSAERRTDTAHTWLDSAVKPKPSMVLVCKDDPRPWPVVHPDNSNIDSDRLERCIPVSQVLWQETSGCNPDAGDVHQ